MKAVKYAIVYFYSSLHNFQVTLYIRAIDRDCEPGRKEIFAQGKAKSGGGEKCTGQYVFNITGSLGVAFDFFWRKGNRLYMYTIHDK